VSCAKHTEGPWVGRGQGDADAFTLMTEDGRWLFAFRQNGERWTPEQQANLRLIASAPDLLAALQEVLAAAVREPFAVQVRLGIDRAQAVISKATGDAS